MKRDPQSMKGVAASQPAKRKRGKSEEEKRRAETTESAPLASTVVKQEQPAKKSTSRAKAKGCKAKGKKQEGSNAALQGAKSVPVNAQGQYDHSLAHEAARKQTSGIEAFISQMKAVKKAEAVVEEKEVKVVKFEDRERIDPLIPEVEMKEEEELSVIDEEPEYS